MNTDADAEKNGTILVVDDTPASIGMIQAALEQENYQVLIATSGEKALERIEFVDPDLILLDIMMPGIDGYETCLQLKSQEKTKDIPVIFLSALSDTFDKVRGFSIGGVDYLTKPVEPEELLIRVKTHIRLNQLEKQLQNMNKELEMRVEIRTLELKEATRSVLEKEAILRGIFEMSPIGIGIISMDGGIQDYNNSFGHFFGINQPSDFSKYNFFSDPNYRTQMISKHNLEDTISFEGLYDFNLIKAKKIFQSHKNGSYYYSIMISPYYDPDSKKLSGYIIFIQDITDWKIKERRTYR